MIHLTCINLKETIVSKKSLSQKPILKFLIWLNLSFFFKFLKNIYLAVPGFICSMSLVAACGISFLTRDQTRAPCIGSTRVPVTSLFLNMLIWVLKEWYN